MYSEISLRSGSKILANRSSLKSGTGVFCFLPGPRTLGFALAEGARVQVWPPWPGGAVGIRADERFLTTRLSTVSSRARRRLRSNIHSASALLTILSFPRASNDRVMGRSVFAVGEIGWTVTSRASRSCSETEGIGLATRLGVKSGVDSSFRISSSRQRLSREKTPKTQSTI